MITTYYGTNSSDILSGGPGEDWIFGLGGNDDIWGGGGNDYLNGGDGDDTLHGREGDDYLYGGNGNDLIILGQGSNIAVGGDGDDEIVMIGGVGTQKIYGGNGNDYILLDNNVEANNYISGGNGDDYILRRGDSNDTISGGTGNDTILIIDEGVLRGGLGDDIFVVSYISSVSVIEYENEGIDEVQSERTFTLGSHLENLTLLSETSDIWHDTDLLQELNFNGYGNNLDNVIIGNIGENILAGYGGSDTLDGNTGADQLIGGAKADQLIGGGGNDILIGTDRLTIFGAVNKGLDKGVGSIDTLIGGVGHDRFILGQHGYVFYDDGKSNGFGQNDFALISDFKKAVDTIQLWGKASNYTLGSGSIVGLSGTAIYLKTQNNLSDELIAIVQGSSNLNLGDSYFEYKN